MPATNPYTTHSCAATTHLYTTTRTFVGVYEFYTPNSSDAREFVVYEFDVVT